MDDDFKVLIILTVGLVLCPSSCVSSMNYDCSGQTTGICRSPLSCAEDFASLCPAESSRCCPDPVRTFRPDELLRAKLPGCDNNKCLNYYNGWWLNPCIPPSRTMFYCAAQDVYCCTSACRITTECEGYGGYCVSNPNRCGGVVLNSLCRGISCYCCVPPPTTSTMPVSTTSTTPMETTTTPLPTITTTPVETTATTTSFATTAAITSVPTTTIAVETTTISTPFETTTTATPPIPTTTTTPVETTATTTPIGTTTTITPLVPTTTTHVETTAVTTPFAITTTTTLPITTTMPQVPTTTTPVETTATTTPFGTTSVTTPGLTTVTTTTPVETTATTTPIGTTTITTPAPTTVTTTTPVETAAITTPFGITTTTIPIPTTTTIPVTTTITTTPFGTTTTTKTTPVLTTTTRIDVTTTTTPVPTTTTTIPTETTTTSKAIPTSTTTKGITCGGTAIPGAVCPTTGGPGVACTCPKSCSDYGPNYTGIAEICPSSICPPVKVKCRDGWTINLCRNKTVDPPCDFKRDWNEYKRGFGSADGEYWLGNEHLHALTGATAHHMRMHGIHPDGSTRTLVYSLFSVGSESTNYRLTISGYDATSSTGYDLFVNPPATNWILDGASFCTRDRDNDKLTTGSCSLNQNEGGWWFNDCTAIKPTQPNIDWYFWNYPTYTQGRLQYLHLEIKRA